MFALCQYLYSGCLLKMGKCKNKFIKNQWHVDKAFPGVKALNNACLSVYTGRVMALMGENGAGKSTDESIDRYL